MKQALLLLIIISFLLGCKKEKDNSPSITMFSTSNGLPSDCVYCIKEDNAGNIWIGTENGVCRYNGVQWQTYFDTLKLFSKRVNNIFVDNAGNIWFYFLGDANTLYKYNGSTLEKTNKFEELYMNLDSSRNYYYSGRKIYQYKGNGFKEIDIPLVSDDHCAINQVLLDSKGQFWVSLEDYCLKGVTKYDGNNWKDYITRDIFNNELIGNSIYGIIESKKGKVLFSAGTSIIQYDGNNWSVFLDFSSKLGKLTFSYGLFEDSRGNIWFGLDKLYKYDFSKFKRSI